MGFTWTHSKTLESFLICAEGFGEVQLVEGEFMKPCCMLFKDHDGAHNQDNDALEIDFMEVE